MRWMILFFILFFAGCTQLLNPQEQPVIEKDYKQKIYSTTCSGTVEDWGSCNLKANRTCSGSYVSLKKFESPVGGRREFTFQCVK